MGGAKTVVLTSLDVPEVEGKLTVIGSEKDSTDKVVMQVTKIPGGWFCGTGDIFTALMVSWLKMRNQDLKQAIENTVNTIHSILQATVDRNKIDANSAVSKELAM